MHLFYLLLICGCINLRLYQYEQSPNAGRSISQLVCFDHWYALINGVIARGEATSDRKRLDSLWEVPDGPWELEMYFIAFWRQRS